MKNYFGFGVLVGHIFWRVFIALDFIPKTGLNVNEWMKKNGCVLPSVSAKETVVKSTVDRQQEGVRVHERESLATGLGTRQQQCSQHQTTLPSGKVQLNGIRTREMLSPYNCE